MHSTHPNDYMTLAQREDAYRRAESGVLKLASSPIAPSEVVAKLSDIDSYFVRSAFWILLDDQKIMLTKDRKIVTTQ